MSTFRGILGRSAERQQGIDVQPEDYAYDLSNQNMGALAMDAMQVIDRIYNELLSAFDMEKLREVLVAYNSVEDPGRELLQKAMQDKSFDRDKKAMQTFRYVWETSFLTLFDRGAIYDCLAEDLDAENLPDAVQHQLDQMIASVKDYERQQSAAARISAAPKLSSNDVAGFRTFVQGDAMGKAPASVVAIRKKIESDPKFAEFAAKELKITKPLLGFVDKYNATPAARLRAIDGVVKIGTEQTGIFTASKVEFDSWLQDAANARLL